MYYIVSPFISASYIYPYSGAIQHNRSHKWDTVALLLPLPNRLLLPLLPNTRRYHYRSLPTCKLRNHVLLFLPLPTRHNVIRRLHKFSFLKQQAGRVPRFGHLLRFSASDEYHRRPRTCQHSDQKLLYAVISNCFQLYYGSLSHEGICR